MGKNLLLGGRGTFKGENAYISNSTAYEERFSRQSERDNQLMVSPVMNPFMSGDISTQALSANEFTLFPITRLERDFYPKVVNHKGTTSSAGNWLKFGLYVLELKELRRTFKLVPGTERYIAMDTAAQTSLTMSEDPVIHKGAWVFLGFLASDAVQKHACLSTTITGLPWKIRSVTGLTELPRSMPVDLTTSTSNKNKVPMIVYLSKEGNEVF